MVSNISSGIFHSTKTAICPARSISRSLYMLLPSIILTGIFASLPAQEQEVALLFRSSNPIHLEIIMDMRAVLRDVGEDPSDHPAVLSYTSEDGDTLSIPIKISPRGHFRKDPMNCNFPPLLLDFDKDSLQGTVFDGQNKIRDTIWHSVPCGGPRSSVWAFPRLLPGRS